VARYRRDLAEAEARLAASTGGLLIREAPAAFAVAVPRRSYPRLRWSPAEQPLTACEEFGGQSLEVIQLNRNHRLACNGGAASRQTVSLIPRPRVSA
jgi:hypothetical protein